MPQQIAKHVEALNITNKIDIIFPNIQPIWESYTRDTFVNTLD